MKNLFFLGLFCGCLYYGLKTGHDARATAGMILTTLLWIRLTRPSQPLPSPTVPDQP